MSRKRTSDEQPPEATNPDAAVPAAESNAERPSFADRFGERQRNAAPDPFGIASDAIAGVRLFESRQDHQVAIKFGDGRPEDKPSQVVRDKLKEAGYRWNPTDKIWAHPVGGDSAVRTRIEAERLYQEVRQMIRDEKGAEAGQDIPF
jgi:hypothetical protein